MPSTAPTLGASKTVDLDAEVPRRFLEGYHRVRSLSHEELDLLPLMSQASAVEELLRLEAHVNAQPQPDWPEPV